MQSVMGWADERGIQLDAEALGELCGRLRGSRMLFEEDGGLQGSSIVGALREQAKLLQPENWANARLLLSLADRAQGTLDGMGLL